jgi:hypothetical protein
LLDACTTIGITKSCRDASIVSDGTLLQWLSLCKGVISNYNVE